jgi:hypothetical protein
MQQLNHNAIATELEKRGPLRDIPVGLGATPKFSTGLQLQVFREALWEHYGLTQAERETHLAWFLSTFSIAWYAARGTTWEELAERFHDYVGPVASGWN